MENKENKSKEKYDKDFKHIIRLANADLNGNRKIITSLQSIKGVSFMFANAICEVAGIDPNKKAGTLTDEEVSKLETVLKDPVKFGVPSWMFNRRRDLETNEDKHLVGVDLQVKHEEDIRRMKMIKSYRGIRHMFHLPVRGQKTRSNFRRSKGRVVGVTKRASKAAAAKKSSSSSGSKK